MTVHVGRKNFGKLPKIFEMPNLLEIQVDSYEIFLQINTPKTKLKSQGLHKVLNEIFPIESYDQTYKLEYVNYSAGTPRYSIDESITKGATYAAPLKLTLRLKSKKDVKEQEVYFGEFPLMTPHGTFIINGDERVVVSQLHRSPGVIFEESVHPNGRTFFSSRIIPYHGAWIEIEFDLTDALYVILDRRRKVLATVFLRALGYNTDEEILATFCGVETIKVESKSDLKDLVNKITAADVRDESGNFVLLEKRHLLTEEELEKLGSKRADVQSDRHAVSRNTQYARQRPYQDAGRSAP
jgi:DNA-directed RNA polymerase subunit beta